MKLHRVQVSEDEFPVRLPKYAGVEFVKRLVSWDGDIIYDVIYSTDD